MGSKTYFCIAICRRKLLLNDMKATLISNKSPGLITSKHASIAGKYYFQVDKRFSEPWETTPTFTASTTVNKPPSCVEFTARAPFPRPKHSSLKHSSNVMSRWRGNYIRTTWDQYKPIQMPTVFVSIPLREYLFLHTKRTNKGYSAFRSSTRRCRLVCSST